MIGEFEPPARPWRPAPVSTLTICARKSSKACRKAEDSPGSACRERTAACGREGEKAAAKGLPIWHRGLIGIMAGSSHEALARHGQAQDRVRSTGHPFFAHRPGSLVVSKNARMKPGKTTVAIVHQTAWATDAPRAIVRDLRATLEHRGVVSRDLEQSWGLGDYQMLLNERSSIHLHLVCLAHLLADPAMRWIASVPAIASNKEVGFHPLSNASPTCAKQPAINASEDSLEKEQCMHDTANELEELLAAA